MSVRERSRAGFTLLEVLVALAILTVGSTCIVALYSAALETYRRSQIQFLATNVALDVLDTGEELLARGADPEKLTELLGARIELPPRFAVELAVEPAEEGAVVLKVSVIAEGRGRSRRFSWARTVLRGAGSAPLPLPRRAPRRYP